MEPSVLTSDVTPMSYKEFNKLKYEVNERIGYYASSKITSSLREYKHNIINSNKDVEKLREVHESIQKDIAELNQEYQELKGEYEDTSNNNEILLEKLKKKYNIDETTEKAIKKKIEEAIKKKIAEKIEDLNKSIKSITEKKKEIIMDDVDYNDMLIEKIKNTFKPHKNTEFYDYIKDSLERLNATPIDLDKTADQLKTNLNKLLIIYDPNYSNKYGGKLKIKITINKTKRNKSKKQSKRKRNKKSKKQH
jgi:hypothetical protein